MKWNLWLSFVAMISVYFALALPLWYQLSHGIRYSAPPGTAFVFAIPYALASGGAVFLVVWLLQTQLKI